MRSNDAIPSSPHVTASPSMMQECEHSSASASTTSGKRPVRSLPGRPIFLSRSGPAHTSPMLLPEMMKVYALLDAQAGVISPYAIRKAPLELQSKGAVWDPEEYAILSHAALRTSPAWEL